MGHLDNILLAPTMVRPGDHDPYTPSALRNLRLHALFEGDGRHVWLGRYPPFECTALDLPAVTAFRAHALLHGQFDVVWCCAPEAFDDSSWPVVLDEAIRLIGRKGHLVVRFPDHFPSMIRMKSFLARKYGVSVRIDDELRTPQGLFAILGVERSETDVVGSKAWTIGILTSGNRTDVVLRMLESIRSSAGGADHEILLFGPESNAFAPFNVRYLTDEEFGIRPDLNEISRKKNLIATEARHENLIISHDRYVLGPGFFESFEDFGYDFDFAVAPQAFDDGQPFPALGLVGGLRLDRLQYVSDFGEYHENTYVNGGFLIVKASLMKAIPMNALCFWNQAEDAEYGAVLREHGIVPRVNAAALAVTSGVSKQHVCQFRNVDGGGELLLEHYRPPTSRLKHHWQHPGYRVAEKTTTIDSGGALKLVLVGDPDVRQAFVVLDIQAADPTAQIWRRSSNDGVWETLDLGAVNADGSHRYRLAVQLREGGCDLDFKIGSPWSGEDRADETRVAGKSVGSIGLVELGEVRPVTLEFNHGAYGLESDGSDDWQWLAGRAGLVLLNANPFPIAAVFVFSAEHFALGGRTLVSFEGGGDLTLDAANTTPITIALVLQPGATCIDLKSVGAFRDGKTVGDARPLSLMLKNWRVESYVETTELDRNWQQQTPYIFGHNGVNAHAVVMDCTDDECFVTLEARLSWPSEEPVALTCDGNFRFSGISSAPTKFCLDLTLPRQQQRRHLLRRPDSQAFLVTTASATNTDPWDAPTFTAIKIGRLVEGEPMRFGLGEPGLTALGVGWDTPEAESVWSRSRRSTLSLTTEPHWQGPGSLDIELNVFCAPEMGYLPSCSIWINGRPCKEWTPRINAFERVRIDLSRDMLVDGSVQIEMRQSAINSPMMLGLSRDSRLLGCQLREILLTHDTITDH